MCLLEKEIDLSHMLDFNQSKGAKIAKEVKRVAKFIAFGHLNIQTGELKFDANGHLQYLDKEITHESMMEPGVLGTQIHYAELVCNTMTEFGVYLEGTTDTVAAKKLQRHRFKLTRMRGKLCHDFVHGRCILCNTNTKVYSVASSKPDTKPAAKDLTKSQHSKPISFVFSKPDSKFTVETSIALTRLKLRIIQD